MTNWQRVPGVVMQGHGVASGQGQDPRYPQGTIALQKPVFAAQGVSLNAYFSGTLNISIQPYQYAIKAAKYTLRAVQWTMADFTEDFSFFDCQLILKGNRTYPGLIYYPHPETKPEHFQSPDVLEILTEYIADMQYGEAVLLAIDPTQIAILPPPG
jgi:hypothetical protein